MRVFQVYGIRTRGRAVDIFNTCAGLIATMNELQKVSKYCVANNPGGVPFPREVDESEYCNSLSVHLCCGSVAFSFLERTCVFVRQQGITKQLLFPVLPQFTEAFVASMQIADGPTSDSGLKMEVLKVRRVPTDGSVRVCAYVCVRVCSE